MKDLFKNDPLPKLTRRDFLRVAGIAAAGSALAACGINAPQPRPVIRGPIQLVYQDWRTEWFPALAQEMLAEFNEQQPGIRVFYTPDPEKLEDELPADMAAGSGPDILSGCCDFLPAWANAGYLLDLRPFVEADLDKGIISEWSQAQYQALFTRDGLQFGLPKYHGALALFYNKDLFDAAGVDYPNGTWTHPDYLEAMKKLSKGEGSARQWGSMFDVSWDRVQMHVNGWGGHFVDPQNPKHCLMSATPAQDAMEWLRARIWDDRVMPTFLDVQNLETREAFIEQRIAMVEDGSWALKDILEGAQFRVGVAPFPAGPQRRVTLATTDGFSINANTRHPEAAWEFLKFLISKEYGRAMARAHFLQPARSSLVPEWVDFIRAEYPQKAKEIDLAAFADGHIKGYSVTAEIFPNMIGVGKLAEDIWDQVYTLGKSPVSDIEDICQQIEAIQNRTGQVPDSCNCAPAS